MKKVTNEVPTITHEDPTFWPYVLTLPSEGLYLVISR